MQYQDGITPNLTKIVNKLKNTKPLMNIWAESRTRIFNDQFQNELNPKDERLRPLSTAYLKWKNINFPGRKKRELTGKTIKSRQIKITRNTVTETISRNAIYLQNNLNLPLLPDEWVNPTSDRLLKDAELFLDF